MTHDFITFLKQIIRNPRQIGAIAPSSLALSQRMAQEVAGCSGTIIELGAGTGSITRALLSVGIVPEKLHLVEIDARFVCLLRREFPNCHVHEIMAHEITTLKLDNVEAVVSSLPILNFSMPVLDDMLTAIFDVLSSGGAYVQFTYGPTQPLDKKFLAQFDIEWTCSERILRNLPPACVYTFRQRGKVSCDSLDFGKG